jgi:hypothetical protein
MDDEARFAVRKKIPRHEQEQTEYRITERDPVRIYSCSGTLLREYPTLCELVIPECDRGIILYQVMVQCRESDVAFSKQDLLLAAEYQFSEVRLIGRSYLFTLKPSEKNWPEPERLAQFYDEIQNNPGLTLLLEKFSTSPELLDTSWDPEVDIIQVRNDIICKKIAVTCGLDYRRTTTTRKSPGSKKATGRSHFRDSVSIGRN